LREGKQPKHDDLGMNRHRALAGIGRLAYHLVIDCASARHWLLESRSLLSQALGLSAVLRVPQRQAQMVSLVLSLIPTTIPSAWVYWQQGWSSPWPVLIGVIAGLIVGNDIGARLANLVDRAALHVLMVLFVSAMALYMAWKAMS
jgi:hypothetical protein